MNRRRFIQQLGSAVAAFTILPSATTYKLRWVKTQHLYIPDPDWLLRQYFAYAAETHRLFGEFQPVIPDSVLRQKLHLPSST